MCQYRNEENDTLDKGLICNLLKILQEEYYCEKIPYVIQVKGSFRFREELLKKLNENAEMRNALDVEKQASNGAGRPVENFRTTVILNWIRKLYENENLPFDPEWNSLRMNLNDWLQIDRDEEDENFFERTRYAFGGARYLDLFSALDRETGIFSGSGRRTPKDFLTEYCSFMAKANNKKVVVFYPRSLEDICAFITVYRHKTSRYYSSLLNALSEAKKRGEEKKRSTRTVVPSAETATVQLNLLTRLAGVDDSDKAVEQTLSHYVEANPEQFEIKKYATILKISFEKLGILGERQAELMTEMGDIRKLKRLFLDICSENLEFRAFIFGEYQDMDVLPALPSCRNDEDRMDRALTAIRAMIILKQLSTCDFEQGQRLCIDHINIPLGEAGFRLLDTTASVAGGNYYTKGNAFDWCVGAFICDECENAAE